LRDLLCPLSLELALTKIGGIVSVIDVSAGEAVVFVGVEKVTISLVSEAQVLEVGDELVDGHDVGVVGEGEEGDSEGDLIAHLGAVPDGVEERLEDVVVEVATVTAAQVLNKVDLEAGGGAVSGEPAGVGSVNGSVVLEAEIHLFN